MAKSIVIGIGYSDARGRTKEKAIAIDRMYLLPAFFFLLTALFYHTLFEKRSVRTDIKSALSFVTRTFLSLLDRRAPRTSPIPVEIYHHILSNLAGNELIACLRTSTSLHDIAASIAYPLLYSSLSLDVGKSVTPLSIRGVPVPLGSGTGKSFEDWDAYQQRESAKSPDYCPQPFTRPDRFSFITFLTLKAHNRGAHCETPYPIIMPNLDTLRILPSYINCHLELCVNADTDQLSCCSIVTHLTPRRLILGGTMTHLTGSLQGLWQPFPPPFLKELVILVGIFAEKASIQEMRKSFFDQLPSTVDKLSLVLSSAEEGWRVFQEDDTEPDVLLDHRDVDVMTHNVALACLGLAKMVEIVGIRGVASCWAYGGGMDPEEEDEAYKLCMRNEVKSHLMEEGEGWKEEDAAARVGAIRFVEEGDFMAENRWYDDPEGRWSAEAVMDHFKPAMRVGAAM